MNAKIRNAQLQKVPYMLVIGDREQEAGAVALRLRDETDLGAKPAAEVVDLIQRVIAEKSLELT
jgi:threonyl-tRNA synthetase